jgi:hypothetical protein
MQSSPLLAPPAVRHTSPGEQLVELRGRQLQVDNLNLMVYKLPWLLARLICNFISFVISYPLIR